MARARNIKPGFFRNAELVELPFEARLLFAGLWTIADREGRLEDRPKQIKMDVFPSDSVDCDALLESLKTSGFIERYTVEGKAYIEILKFTEHQNPHKDEKPSEIPNKHGVLTDSRKGKHRASTVQAPCKVGATSEPILLIPDSLIPDSLIPDSPIPDSLKQKPVKNKNTALIAPECVFPEILDRQIVTDWLAIRKAKDAPATKTALEGISREAEKASMRIGDVIRMCCERNWSSFKASWLSGDGKSGRDPEVVRKAFCGDSEIIEGEVVHG